MGMAQRASTGGDVMVDAHVQKKHRPADGGAINFQHPRDPTHSCSIKLPVSQDQKAQRELEAEVRMRIALLRAA
jgi:hypothetical protein